MEFIKLMIYKLFPSLAKCPREQAGHRCHKDSPVYNFKCDACGRIGEHYDPDIIDRSQYK